MTSTRPVPDRRLQRTTSPFWGMTAGTTRLAMQGSTVMAWIFLLLAGGLEVVWAFLMKASDGFTKPWPTIGTIAFMVVSFGLLSMAMKTLPLGTAYAIWTGIGAVGAFVVGVMVLGEALTPMRIGGVALIVSGLVVLKLASSH